MMSEQTDVPCGKEEYYNILKDLDLLRLDATEFSGKVYDRRRLTGPGGEKKVSMKEKSAISLREDKQTTVHHSYKIDVTEKGEEKTERLLSLSVTFRVLYRHNEPFADRFFAVFQQESLRVQVAPYARAWVHDQCLRMGVPPLIMPLVRIQ